MDIETAKETVDPSDTPDIEVGSGLCQPLRRRFRRLFTAKQLYECLRPVRWHFHPNGCANRLSWLCFHFRFRFILLRFRQYVRAPSSAQILYILSGLRGPASFVFPNFSIRIDAIPCGSSENGRILPEDVLLRRL